MMKIHVSVEAESEDERHLAAALSGKLLTFVVKNTPKSIESLISSYTTRAFIGDDEIISGEISRYDDEGDEGRWN